MNDLDRTGPHQPKAAIDDSNPTVPPDPNGADWIANRHPQRIGRYRIKLKGLNDANPNTGQWSAALTTQNAQTAARDTSTIGYLGDFNSGASAVSIPILNRLAIPQVSATSTAVGLTSDGLGSSPGEQPVDYDPTPRRTFTSPALLSARKRSPLGAVRIRRGSVKPCAYISTLKPAGATGQAFAGRAMT